MMTMNFVTIIALLLLSITLSVEASKVLRGSVTSPSTRKLQDDGMKGFVPLTCNANLASAKCISWSTKFGAATSYTARVVVPCGECVTMDLTGGSLALLGGIDVLGKLVFPDGYKLNLSSTMIAVQGELEMTASKPVDGSPNVKFTMIGEDDKMTFTPIDVNTNACKSVSTCDIGKKAIIVAGGKVNIHGLPVGTPTWTTLYDATGGTFNNPDTILVANTVKGTWAAGADILITSHTRMWNEHQERTILSVTDSSVDGYVALKLNATIIRPTTLIESADFAVEVALLSRNIVFEGGADSEARHGGHFMIMHTPSVVQTVEGIEVKNFGQQGTLGKYPIHFHFCKDVTGSVVSKNTIRQSNQRCVVVHGTNKLRIEENVAFDTKGHCFLTEDGIETGNEFIRNLGAMTGIPETIIPNGGPNGDETDGTPATFWITNPTNSFIGNVAAGSEASGYWFEPKRRGTRAYLFPDYEPQYEPLTAFKDNVAHSNIGMTAVQMYKPGFMPKYMTPLDGLKVYRNIGSGIFVHRCNNINIVNGLFADNDLAIDIDRAEGIEVNDSVIIGESESFRTLTARQTTVQPACRFDGTLKGIDLYTWKHATEYAGAKISNVDISGFGDRARCEKPTTISFDQLTLKVGLFEFYTSFKNIALPDGAESIDMCIVESEDVNMAYIVDVDGNLRPKSVSTTGPSTLLASDGGQLLKFVDTTKCTDVAVGCYSYCQETCFRSVRYTVTGAGQENYRLKVCLQGDNSQCTLFTGGRRGNDGPHVYAAHLPVGKSYDAVFVDSTNSVITPDTLEAQYEESFCPTTGANGEFQIAMLGNLPLAAPPVVASLAAPPAPTPPAPTPPAPTLPQTAAVQSIDEAPVAAPTAKQSIFKVNALYWLFKSMFK